MFDNTHQYEAKILVNDNAITEYLHENNTYVEGRPGSRYLLSFKNYSNERIMVVPSVDGLSIMTGTPADLTSLGYVLTAGQEMQVPGWTLDNNSVAEFLFGDLKDSYNKKSSNDTSNVGVIGFLVFREYVPLITTNYPPAITTNFPPPQHPWYDPTATFVGHTDWTPFWNKSGGGVSGSINHIAPGGAGLAGGSLEAGRSGSASLGMDNSAHSIKSMSARASASDSSPSLCGSVEIGSIGTNSSQPETLPQEMGTGFGSAVDYKVSTTYFTKRDPQYPDAMIAIYYDSYRGLVRKGVIIDRKNRSMPNPFPIYQAAKTGCAPPKGWRR